MDMNNVELLKMLLVKCADPGNPNPVMKNGVETLLRQLHGELPLLKHRKNVQNTQNMHPKQTKKPSANSSTENEAEETKPDFPIAPKQLAGHSPSRNCRVDFVKRQ